MKNKARLLLSLLIPFSLTGCLSDAGTSQVSSECSVSYADPYEDPFITEDYLEQSLCMVFEDLRFVKGEGGKNDHAFAMKDGKVSEHRSYERKERSLSDFQAIVGLPLFDAMETIGIPSFRGRYDEGPSLTYVISPESYATVYIEKNHDSKWTVSSLKTFDEQGFSEDFGRQYESSDIQKRSYTPSFERVRAIPMGMLFDDALFILGRPSGGKYHGLREMGECSGSWNMERKCDLYLSARWIDSSYPAFEKDNCPKGSNTYCGVSYVYLSKSRMS